VHREAPGVSHELHVRRIARVGLFPVEPLRTNTSELDNLVMLVEYLGARSAQLSVLRYRAPGWPHAHVCAVALLIAGASAAVAAAEVATTSSAIASRNAGRSLAHCDVVEVDRARIESDAEAACSLSEAHTWKRQFPKICPVGCWNRNRAAVNAINGDAHRPIGELRRKSQCEIIGTISGDGQVVFQPLAAFSV